jgi:hypothetical protein
MVWAEGGFKHGVLLESVGVASSFTSIMQNAGADTPVCMSFLYLYESGPGRCRRDQRQCHELCVVCGIMPIDGTVYESIVSKTTSKQ